MSFLLIQLLPQHCFAAVIMLCMGRWITKNGLFSIQTVRWP